MATGESDDDAASDYDALTAADASFSDRYTAARTAIDALAKPPGSLGTLEEWCARLCALQRRRDPRIESATIVFVADHGVAKPIEDGGEGCSAYPPAVTTAIAALIARGRGGVSAIAAAADAGPVTVYDVGLASGGGDTAAAPPGVHQASFRLQGGTACFTTDTAISDLDRLMTAGADAVDALDDSVTVVVLGEVGIGNTTTAAALYAALASTYRENAEDADSMSGSDDVNAVCGRGTGLDAAGVARKVDIVSRALKRHADVVRDAHRASRDGAADAGSAARRVLAALGGAEVAAMAGAAIRAYERGIAVMVGGFIATAAALAAASIEPKCTQSMFLTSLSAERGHAIAHKRIAALARAASLPEVAMPALAMGLCLGEGTAAALGVPLLRAAATLLPNMATLEEALSGGA